jgi:CheY-like chemotaxis protein
VETASDPYEDVALTNIRIVRQDSPAAADTIEHIHANFGSHAALRAALIIRLLKMEVQQNHWLPGIGLYVHLLADYPDVLPLTKYAMTCCLQSWATPIGATGDWISLATAYICEQNSKPPPSALVSMAVPRLTVLEPENLGKGGRFHSESVSEARLRIVIVADNRFAQMVLELFVAAHNDMVVVGEAHDGTQAVQVAAQSQPDILLMDFNLLALDRIAAIRQIKLDNPQIHIILLTAEADLARLNAALGAGADVYLPQMTFSTKLADTIQRVRQLA